MKQLTFLVARVVCLHVTSVRADSVTIKPGDSIGPIHLGMTNAELKAIPATTWKAITPTELQGGGYVVMIGTNQRVREIDFSPSEAGNAPLSVSGKAWTPGSAVKDLAALLPGCEATKVGEGGMSTVCDGVVLSAAGDRGYVTISVLPAGAAVEPAAIVKTGSNKLSVRVKSGGCTHADSFDVQFQRDAKSQTVTLVRTNPDHCEVAYPNGLVVDIDVKGLDATKPIKLANPAWPSTATK